MTDFPVIYLPEYKYVLYKFCSGSGVQMPVRAGYFSPFFPFQMSHKNLNIVNVKQFLIFWFMTYISIKLDTFNTFYFTSM